MVVKKESLEDTNTDNDAGWLDSVEEEICERKTYPELGGKVHLNSHASPSRNAAKFFANGETKHNEEHKEKEKPVPEKETKSEEKDPGTRAEAAKKSPLIFRLEFDGIALLLFLLCFLTRVYELKYPENIVFDELHYAKYVSMYMQRMFFFDSNPPLGKQLMSISAYLSGYDGVSSFPKIGAPYSANFPIISLRLVPALFGSLLAPVTYKVGLELGLSPLAAALAAGLVILDNALLTQSRLILMESILIFFAVFGLYGVLRLRRLRDAPFSPSWWFWLSCSILSLTAAVCVKYSGAYPFLFGVFLLLRDFWETIPDRRFSRRQLVLNGAARAALLVALPAALYFGTFYVHLSLLTRAGPHDSVMSSSFQASLEGGLASIVAGQPLEVVHGSQVTLRRGPSPPCWLHSHPKVYPVRYADNRGSSHQQQVTCYRYKDVNNWWIVKRPEINDLVAHPPLIPIKHGDVVQLVHGMTSRALNTHDVAAPVSPSKQEVSCYIDYEVDMPSQNLWRVEVVNRDAVGDVWHIVESRVQLIHVNTSHALSTSGKLLPEWGANQDEVVGERSLAHPNSIWNVEEHRHTEGKTQTDREKELVFAEMIPTSPTQIPIWVKFLELQAKMLLVNQENVKSHLYSSNPYLWPLMDRGIAYYVSNTSNAQIHLLGNVVSWNTGAICILTYSGVFLFYTLRRRRAFEDLDQDTWRRFLETSTTLILGFLFNYLPYFFLDQTLFLHHYLPCLVYKFWIIMALLEHVDHILGSVLKLNLMRKVFLVLSAIWFLLVTVVFYVLTSISYGTYPLKASEVRKLEWKENWDLIVHKT